MSGVKGGLGVGIGVHGGGGAGTNKQGGDGGQVNICQDTEPVKQCQNVTPAPVQCKEIVDPCQDNQSGSIGGGQGGGYGGHGGQVSHGSGVKK